MWKMSLLNISVLFCLVISKTFCQDFMPIDHIVKHFTDDLQRNLTAVIHEYNQQVSEFMIDQKRAINELGNKFNGLETEVTKVQEVLTFFRTNTTEEFAGKISSLEQYLLRDLSSLGDGIAAVQESCIISKLNSSSEVCRNCPSRWSEFENSCYHVSEEKGSWLAGLNYCRGLDADYVKISSQAEWEFVKREVQGETAFIGLNDIEEEGTYRWNSDLSIAEFTKWKVGEPDDSKGVYDCVVALSDGTWVSYFCKTNYRFVCEKSIEKADN